MRAIFHKVKTFEEYDKEWQKSNNELKEIKQKTQEYGTKRF